MRKTRSGVQYRVQRERSKGCTARTRAALRSVDDRLSEPRLEPVARGHGAAVTLVAFAIATQGGIAIQIVFGALAAPCFSIVVRAFRAGVSASDHGLTVRGSQEPIACAGSTSRRSASRTAATSLAGAGAARSASRTAGASD